MVASGGYPTVNEHRFEAVSIFQANHSEPRAGHSSRNRSPEVRRLDELTCSSVQALHSFTAAIPPRREHLREVLTVDGTVADQIQFGNILSPRGEDCREVPAIDHAIPGDVRIAG